MIGYDTLPPSESGNDTPTDGMVYDMIAAEEQIRKPGDPPFAHEVAIEDVDLNISSSFLRPLGVINEIRVVDGPDTTSDYPAAIAIGAYAGEATMHHELFVAKNMQPYGKLPVQWRGQDFDVGGYWANSPAQMRMIVAVEQPAEETHGASGEVLAWAITEAMLDKLARDLGPTDAAQRNVRLFVQAKHGDRSKSVEGSFTLGDLGLRTPTDGLDHDRFVQIMNKNFH